MTSYMCLVPSVAPMGLVVTRSPDGLSMSISWSPLTLSQARGFVDYYAISYGPVGQLLTSTTTTNGTNFVVSGLSAVLAYNVAVRGHTIVGVGPIATMIVMSVPTAGEVTYHLPPPPLTSTHMCMMWEIFCTCVCVCVCVCVHV